MFSIITTSVKQTESVGRMLGELLLPGDLVCLYGDLGSGKTHLSYGIALGLHVRDRYVTSPTFTFVNEYEGRIPFYHIDLYRLKDPADLEGIGFQEYIDSDGATVIEWAERAEQELPPDCLSVYLSDVSANSREIGFFAEGERHTTLLNDLKRRIENQSIETHDQMDH
jgi:tRNA threonylcarbamoyladenosine biosynthesis protein TsaE